MPQLQQPDLHPAAERAHALGLTVVRLLGDGEVQPLHEPGCFDRVLLQSPLFRAAVSSHVAPIRSAGRVTLWPGVSLVPLHTDPAPVTAQAETLAALLLSTDLLTSEQLHNLCSAAGLDHAATAARLAAAGLPTPADADRLAAALGFLHDDAARTAADAASLDSLTAELTDTYEELSLIYKLSSSMALDHPADDFFDEACADLRDTGGFDSVSIYLRGDEPRLGELRGRLFTAGLTAAQHDQAKRLGERLIADHGDSRDAVPLDDTAPLAGLADGLASRVLTVPLRAGATLGVLFTGQRDDGEAFDSFNLKLCSSLSTSLGIFLENTLLYGDVRDMFMGTLHALTAAIDAKDSYTHGHSERVAMLSRELAKAAGLDAETVQRVYLAGLVHDVGKIGVPEAVLCKPGRLTDEEFALIKMHPRIGANILKDIRQMHDLIPGVLYHHEKYDGGGYPDGLAGNDIPLFGRLIGLADAFDAMSSTRTYRAALDPDHVLAEVRRCAGTQFDPGLAAVFLGLDFTEYHRMVGVHQRADRLAAQRLAGAA